VDRPGAGGGEAVKEIEERLKHVDAMLLSFAVMAAQLGREKYLLEVCLKNPSLDNLRILADYQKTTEDFIVRMMKKEAKS
jgi:hypothetical protein